MVRILEEEGARVRALARGRAAGVGEPSRLADFLSSRARWRIPSFRA